MPGLENRSRMQTLSGPTSLGVLPFGEAMQVPSCWHEPAPRSVATAWVDSLSGSTGECLCTSPAVGAFLGEQSPSSSAVGRGIPSVEIALQELLRRFWRAEEVLSAHFIFEDAPAVGAFKIGKELFTAAGPDIVRRLRATGAAVCRARVSAIANDSGFLGSASTPVVVVTTSGIPPTRVATTGVP